jgi:hypothetical protein
MGCDGVRRRSAQTNAGRASFAQPDARAFPILRHEDYAGLFEGGALRHIVATSHRAAGVDKTA